MLTWEGERRERRREGGWERGGGRDREGERGGRERGDLARVNVRGLKGVFLSSLSLPVLQTAL